jgi:hypothetical protein
MSVAPENGQLATHQRTEQPAKLTCRCHVCDALQLHARYVLLQKTPRVTMPQEATQNSVWEYRAIKKGQGGAAPAATPAHTLAPEDEAEKLTDRLAVQWVDSPAAAARRGCAR